MSALDAIVLVFAGLGGAGLAYVAAYGIRALWAVATSWWRR